MKTATILLFLILLTGYVVADGPIALSPVPPIGAKITQDSEGIIRIEMTESGTAILGTCKVISREGNRPDMPGRYHIEFKAMGKRINPTGNSEVSLVVYLDRGAFRVNPAHGGTVLLPSSKEWSGMRTTFLNKSGGAGKVENVILGIYFKEPGNIELKGLSCRAVDLPSD